MKTTYQFPLVTFAALLPRTADFSLRCKTDSRTHHSITSTDRRLSASSCLLNIFKCHLYWNPAVYISPEILIWLALNHLGWMFAINWLAHHCFTPHPTPSALRLAKRCHEYRRDLSCRVPAWGCRASAQQRRGFLCMVHVLCVRYDAPPLAPRSSPNKTPQPPKRSKKFLCCFSKTTIW